MLKEHNSCRRERMVQVFNNYRRAKILRECSGLLKGAAIDIEKKLLGGCNSY